MCPIPQNKRLSALAALLALAVAGSLCGTPAYAASDIPPEGYPSWQDVEKARQTQAGTSAEVARISGLLDGLQTRSEALGNAAVTAAADYAFTESDRQAAAATVDALAVKVALAGEEAGRYRKGVGALAAQSYKTGGTNMGFFVALDAVQTNSVHGLNIVRIVSDKTAALLHKSAEAEKAGEALVQQERAARAERERLAGEAKTKLATAQAAQQAMSRQVAEHQERNAELTAQLASLKGTTAEVEGKFRQGQDALEAFEVSQAAKREAAEEQARRQAGAAANAPPRPTANPAPQNPAPANPAPQNPAPQNPAPGVAAPVPPAQSPAPTLPPVVVVPSVPGGAVNDPTAARNYAAGRLSAYGWGQDQFQCLAQLWTKESNWLTTATNPYSGAYGIAQALPASRYASAGSDWLTSYRTQVDWGLGYILDRYRSPCAAWNHSMVVNWY